MPLQPKLAVAALVLALGCTPLLAQQGPADNPPPPQSASADRGAGGPGMRGRGMGAWGRPGPQRGFGSWGAGDRRAGGMRPGFGPGRRGFGRDRGQAGIERALRDPQIRQQVGISDQEAAKLEQDIASFRKEQIQDRANLEIQRIDLQNLLSAQTPDRDAIDSKLQQVGAAQLALQKSSVDFRVTLKQEVTPEQRQKIRQLFRDRRGPQPGMQRGARTEPMRRARRPANSQGAPPNAPPPPANQ